MVSSRDLFEAAGPVRLTPAMRGQPAKLEENFNILSTWAPYTSVNNADHVCSEYAGCFEHRRKMEEIGAGHVGRLATQSSIRELFMTATGTETEPLHLRPSAKMKVNFTHLPDFKGARGIHQW